VNAERGGGGDEVRPAGFLAHVLDEHGAPLTKGAERWAFVQLGLELIEFGGDCVGRHLRGDPPPTYARYPRAASSWHDVDGTGDNGAQYRLAAVLGLHLGGQIAKYLGEPSIVLSVHQNLDAK
jgi:hypothetical protein